MYVDEDQDNWDEVLPILTYAYNSGIRTATGVSPYEVTFGREPRLPFENFLVPPKKEVKDYNELVKVVAERIRKIEETVLKMNGEYQTKQKTRYDQKSRKIDFKTGDLVMKKIERLGAGVSKSLSAQFDGPHRVVYCPVDASTVVLRLFDDPDGKYDKVAVEKLKKFVVPLEVANSVFYIDFEQVEDEILSQKP